MKRTTSHQNQFMSVEALKKVEALYAEMDVGAPEATMCSFEDLAKSKVDS